jgi:hypothetical protein
MFSEVGATAFYSVGCRFESCWDRQYKSLILNAFWLFRFVLLGYFRAAEPCRAVPTKSKPYRVVPPAPDSTETARCFVVCSSLSAVERPKREVTLMQCSNGMFRASLTRGRVSS